MAAYPPPPFYHPYQYPPAYPPQSPRRGGAPQNSSRPHHPHSYHPPYPIQHDHHPLHHPHHHQQHQQQHHQHQQHQQHQQPYPLAHPHPTKYLHYGPHHPHHPGYPPYQPQTPQSAASPPYAHQQWQQHLGHGHHHQQQQQQQQQPLSPLPKQLGVMPLPPHPIPSHVQSRGMSPAYFDLQSQQPPSVGSPPVPAATTSSPSAQENGQVEQAPLTAEATTSPAVGSAATNPAATETDAPVSLSSPQQHQASPKVPIETTTTQPISMYKQTGTISITSPSVSNTASSLASPISPASHTAAISPASPITSISPSHNAVVTTAASPLTTAPATSTASAAATAAAKTFPTTLKSKSKAIWAIWSRRPQNPSDAPGIIISPAAHPPPDVVQQALVMDPPPTFAASFSPSAHIVTLDDGGGGFKGPPITPTTPATPTTRVEGVEGAIDGTEIVTLNSEPTDSTVPSSSASVTEGLTDLTDLTDAPTLPGSPASSTTSVSVGQSGKEGLSHEKNGEIEKEKEEEKKAEAPAVDEVTEEPAAGSVGITADTSPAAEDPSAANASETPVPSSAPTPAAITSTTTITSAAPAPLTKSWASLLKPSSSPSGSGPVKNALPTSNVVGISIPASATASSSSFVFGSSASGGGPGGASPGRKAQLLALLTHGPGGVLGAAGNYANAAATSNHASQTQSQGRRLRPRGLVNNGNMCFANSVLQMLVYTPPVQRLFFEIGRLKGVKTPKDAGEEGSGTPLVDAMVEFVKEFVIDAEVVAPSASVNGNANGWGKGKERERGDDDDEIWGGESFVPNYVYEAMKEKKRFDNMRGGQQEDAEEFLGFLLETLEEELVLLKETLTGSSSASQGKHKPVEEREEAAPREEQGWQEVGKKNRTVVTRTIKSTESPISKIFGGKFRTALRVPFTKKDSVIVEDWRSVRLDIQRDQIHTVQDALACISHPQPVQVTNPSRPGTTLEAQQQVHIDALPPVLILHVKRFCYDTGVGGVVKVGKQVRFGPELELVNDVISPGIRKSLPPKYKLFGVLYHHGQSASGGHYTLDVLHPSRFMSPGGRTREGWIRIDDEFVSDVRSEDVFGGEKDENRCAYLLFYKRIR